jgi:molybdopterin synthase catalytic subunit
MNATIISKESLDPEEAGRFVSHPEAGGISIFLGAVRNKNQGKKVVKLHYEAYDAMVIREMEKSILQVREKWQLNRVYLAHRAGDLEIGDIAIVIACSSIHRKEALEATSWLIDDLKARLPIWKKELYEDGSEWLNSRP